MNHAKRVSLRDILLCMTILCILCAWYVDRSRLAQERYRNSKLSLTTGVNALSASKECLALAEGSEQWVFSTNSREQRWYRERIRSRLLHSLYQLAMHESQVDAAASFLNDNDARFYARKIIEHLGCDFEEELCAIGLSVDQQGKVPLEIYEPGTALHSTYIGFVRTILRY